MSARFRLGLAAVVCATVMGCTHVAPYQREYLTRPSMDEQRQLSQASFETHVYDSREGSTGGHGVAGGGCGCN